jgi:hypothetical protein
MIFYTLQGPKSKLEIHHDKLKLTNRAFWNIFSSKKNQTEWKLSELSHFKITVPKFIWGKLEWSTSDGNKESFRFTTNSEMMKKIEKYMQKVIIKNYEFRESGLSQEGKDQRFKLTTRYVA